MAAKTGGERFSPQLLRSQAQSAKSEETLPDQMLVPLNRPLHQASVSGGPRPPPRTAGESRGVRLRRPAPGADVLPPGPSARSLVPTAAPASFRPTPHAACGLRFRGEPVSPPAWSSPRRLRISEESPPFRFTTRAGKIFFFHDLPTKPRPRVFFRSGTGSGARALPVHSAVVGRPAAQPPRRPPAPPHAGGRRRRLRKSLPGGPGAPHPRRPAARRASPKTPAPSSAAPPLAGPPFPRTPVKLGAGASGAPAAREDPAGASQPPRAEARAPRPPAAESAHGARKPTAPGVGSGGGTERAAGAAAQAGPRETRRGSGARPGAPRRAERPEAARGGGSGAAAGAVPPRRRGR